MRSKTFEALGIYLEMIKFQHSIFALPFAMLGMLWAAKGWPGWTKFFWILMAMVSCRSAAMAYNRIVDRDVDALNPRTCSRALVVGDLALNHARLFFGMSCVLFILSAAMLNKQAFLLSPLALGVTLFYSLTKRFTPLSHFVLGLSLAIAPAGAWIAVTGTLSLSILPIVAAVLFWTSGFDMLYSLQDEAFDKAQKLRSLPETLGKSRALWVSRICHILCVAFLAVGGLLNHTGPLYFSGVVMVAMMLFYEQSLVKSDDLSKINLAFFTLNGFVSMGVFVFSLFDWLLMR
jgi:4-hydroxybenzoate polyprenyltransferase